MSGGHDQIDVSAVCMAIHPEDAELDGTERRCIRPAGHPPLVAVVYLAGLGNWYEGDCPYLVTRDRTLAQLAAEAFALEDIRDLNHPEVEAAWAERRSSSPGEMGWPLRRWELGLALDEYAYVEERELR